MKKCQKDSSMSISEISRTIVKNNNSQSIKRKSNVCVSLFKDTLPQDYLYRE